MKHSGCLRSGCKIATNLPATFQATIIVNTDALRKVVPFESPLAAAADAAPGPALLELHSGPSANSLLARLPQNMQHHPLCSRSKQLSPLCFAVSAAHLHPRDLKQKRPLTQHYGPFHKDCR